jgi:predicted AAA+ superfamily ATPase
VETVGSYLAAAEAAFLLIPCPFFAYSERKRASRNKKYYPIDTGLRRAVVTRTGEDRGKSLEILVFLELRRRFPAVYYWRDRGEIDFVVERTAGLTPVIVTEENPQERHEKSLEDFYENFPQGAEAVFVNKKNLTKLLGGFD